MMFSVLNLYYLGKFKKITGQFEFIKCSETNKFEKQKNNLNFLV